MSVSAPADIWSRIARASHGFATLHKRERSAINLGNCALCGQLEHPGACMRKSETKPPVDMGGKKAPGKPGKPGKQLPQDEGSGGEVKSNPKHYIKQTKGEMPMGAKPPSGQNPAKPPAPKVGSPKVGAAPMGKEEKPAQNNPRERPPKRTVVTANGAPASSATQRMYNQYLLTQQRAKNNPKRALGKAELVNGAAHHYAGLFAAVLNKDEEAARGHARLYSAYVRMLDADPSPAKVPAAVKALATEHGKVFASRMMKSESGFYPCVCGIVSVPSSSITHCWPLWRIMQVSNKTGPVSWR